MSAPRLLVANRGEVALRVMATHDEVQVSTIFVTHDQEEALEVADESS